jgi:DNA-binding transcriptional regulator YiaG
MSKQIAKQPMYAVSSVLAKRRATRTLHRTLDDRMIRVVATRIRQRMELLGVTPAQLAVDIGVPRKTIEAWMRGRQLPRADRIGLLAAGLETSSSSLIAGK